MYWATKSGSLRKPRQPILPKATPVFALKASEHRAAGVRDHIMCTKRAWEPEKPYCSAPVGHRRGRVARGNRRMRPVAAGWRIGV